MNEIYTTKLSDMEAIIGGFHSSPYGILGPHLVTIEGESRLSIRAFRPLERHVTVLDIESQARYPMQRIHEQGFFELTLLHPTEESHTTFAYRLQLEDFNGTQHEIEDPYRFPFMLSEYDKYLHAEGTLLESYKKLGAQWRTVTSEAANNESVSGVNFAVWAPNAKRVSVVGSFNEWDNRVHPMQKHDGCGIWELFVPNLPEGTSYKYAILSEEGGYEADKTDPFGFFAEVRPNTASRIWPLDQYEWQDNSWIDQRVKRQALDQPLNIYEVHLGSWKRVPENTGFLSYRDLAHQLVEYVKEMGYTHIELLPTTEHPFDGSWGYQTTGYFAPTSRFGTPADFAYFVDYCHQHEIGVILDWVPAHFPKDIHGLGFFDGTHLYEHADPRQGEHQDWGTKIFNFGRNEVCSFLLNSALFWLKEYHIDGLRVDAVASMLYLDYSRNSDDWIPNQYGGRENLEAIAFIRRFNELTHTEVPGTLTLAEESTSWPMVTHPTYAGGLGFDYKWNMGWMHDMLDYMAQDPVHRRYHHSRITFSLMYAFTENFVLPFSHDEVVHLKRAMLDKMPGDIWQKFANLRALYGYMLGHPGKKLLFMGGEFGQWREWNEAQSLDWHLLDWPEHQQFQKFVSALNHLHIHEPACHEVDGDWAGFQWIDFNDADYSIISFMRIAKNSEDRLIFICNFTPVPRLDYRVGLPFDCAYQELLNSDWSEYGGSGVGNSQEIKAASFPWQSCDYSALLNLPPLGVIILKPLDNIN